MLIIIGGIVFFRVKKVHKVLGIMVLIAITSMPLAAATHTVDDYTVALARYQGAQERFLQSQEELARCKTECGERTITYQRSAANYLSTGADLLHQRLVRLESYARIAGDEGTYREIRAQVGGLDAEVNATRQMAHRLTSRSGEGSLRETEEAVQQAWLKVDALTNSATARIISGNLDTSTRRLAETELKLHIMRDQMAAEGVQSDRLDRLLVEFGDQVDDAQASAAPVTTPGAALQNEAAREDAQTKVARAIATLQEITKEIRTLNGRLPQ